MEHTFDSVFWTDVEEYYGSYRLDMSISTRRYDGILSFTVSLTNTGMFSVVWGLNVFALRGPQDFDTEGSYMVRSKEDALHCMESVVDKLKKAHGGNFAIPYNENYHPDTDDDGIDMNDFGGFDLF